MLFRFLVFDHNLGMCFLFLKNEYMYFSLLHTDELKHIIGAETTRKGILRVFEMFQHNQLNRRMVYVFLEGFLETLFPQYKFRELFNKLHSKSKQMQKYKQKLQSTQAPSLQKR